ncbi:hemolysin family protein [Pedomonas mirosovicensis]|uniref:hemolysin family protein n=1 Tax=Pedomonas mirosovicensis TaxID=2908641 RepID=UPI002166FE9D|nr:hemolysin family protein [Pedomonas mirosovicensis]MCH8684937.1 hemolysin family protein [Pedomonas mirosovicensis]
MADPFPWLELAIVLFLIVLNGFFSMSELAIVSARRVRLQMLADEGDNGAATALHLAEEPTRFLSTVQVGITMVGILTGAYGGATLSEPVARWLSAIPGIGSYAGSIAVALVVILITYLSLIVGELVPKRLALNHAEGIARTVARPMRLLSQVGAPIVWLLQRSTELALKLMGVKPQEQQVVSQQEVRSLIAEGTEAGVFDPDEKEMLEAVIRVSDLPVRALMTPRPELFWLDINDDMNAIRHEVEESGRSRFLVCEGELDKFLGIVEAKQLLGQCLKGEGLELRAHLKNPPVVHEATRVLKVLETIRQSGIHIAVVVNEYGGVEGVVTATDILAAIGGGLPEMNELERPDAVQREDGSWFMDGRIAIHEVERILGRDDLSGHGDYTTLAGFMLWQLEHLPDVAETVDWNDLCFEVADMDEHRIDKVLVRTRHEASA